MLPAMSKILLLTGPGGAGKSTIAQLIVNDGGYVLVDGDHEDTEFFPDGDQWLPENGHLLARAHQKILQKTKALMNMGRNVVVDYIIFGQYQNFITMFQREFGNDFSVKILFPTVQVLSQRDQERECWTTGAERISAVYKEFEDLQKYIGKDCFLDSSEQTPEETATNILESLKNT